MKLAAGTQAGESSLVQALPGWTWKPPSCAAPMCLHIAPLGAQGCGPPTTASITVAYLVLVQLPWGPRAAQRHAHAHGDPGQQLSAQRASCCCQGVSLHVHCCSAHCLAGPHSQNSHAPSVFPGHQAGGCKYAGEGHDIPSPLELRVQQESTERHGHWECGPCKSPRPSGDVGSSCQPPDTQDKQSPRFSYDIPIPPKKTEAL